VAARYSDDDEMSTQKSLPCSAVVTVRLADVDLDTEAVVVPDRDAEVDADTDAVLLPVILAVVDTVSSAGNDVIVELIVEVAVCVPDDEPLVLDDNEPVELADEVTVLLGVV
jgi:hypothetical protein